MHVKLLLWKEFRRSLMLLTVAGVLLLFPYVVAVFTGIVMEIRGDGMAARAWAEYFENAATAGLAVTLLFSAFLAANAYAGEREDRSAEFAAYLPIRRDASALSKLLFAGGTCLAMFLINAAVACGAEAYQYSIHQDFFRSLGVFATLTVLVFGVAWLVSAVVSRAAAAAASGVGSLIVLGFIASFVEEVFSHPEEAGSAWVIVMCLVVSVVCFSAGLIHALRRIEP